MGKASDVPWASRSQAAAGSLAVGGSLIRLISSVANLRESASALMRLVLALVSSPSGPFVSPRLPCRSVLSLRVSFTRLRLHAAPCRLSLSLC